jgi:hypothetical protein
MLKAYEKFLNRKQKNSYTRTRMIFLPVPFDRILLDLNKGRGDIAASIHRPTIPIASEANYLYQCITSNECKQNR